MKKASERKTEEELVYKIPCTHMYFYTDLPNHVMHVVMAFISDQWLLNLSVRTAP